MFIGFRQFFAFSSKTDENITVVSQKIEFFFKVCFLGICFFSKGFTTTGPMMLKFGQDVAIRGTEKLELFFSEKVCRHRATHFFIRKIRIFTKTQFLRIKKCVVPQRNTFSGKNNISFSIHLRATCWSNFRTIALLVAKP